MNDDHRSALVSKFLALRASQLWLDTSSFQHVSTNTGSFLEDASSLHNN